MCNRRTAGIIDSCADDAGEGGCKQHANALRTLCVARADHQRNADQSDIQRRAFQCLNETQRVSTRVSSTRIRCIFCRILTGGSDVIGF